GRMAAALSEYLGDDRGPLRRTRHPRIQFGARRAPRTGRQKRAGRPRGSGLAYPDDQLRQGTPRDPALGRCLLRAEPARRHDRKLRVPETLPLAIFARWSLGSALFLPKTAPNSSLPAGDLLARCCGLPRDIGQMPLTPAG